MQTFKEIPYQNYIVLVA